MRKPAWYALIAMIFGALSQSIPAVAATGCIGHKGDLDRAFENSMAAFVSAYDRGAGGIEYDLRHTLDGVAVVAHDPDLRNVGMAKPGRDCPLLSPIRTLSLQTIRENCQLKNGEDMPTLEDVLARFADKDLTLLTEFEDPPSAGTYRLIRRYYRAHPERIRLLGVSPFPTLIEIHLKRQLSGFWSNVKIFSTDPKFKGLNMIGYDGADVSEISDLQIRRIHRHGKEVSLWTVNTPEAARKYMDLDVEFITTDHLDVCLDAARR